MEFKSSITSRTYSDRVADQTWSTWASENLSPRNKDVVDIGCGGGIYSFAFASLGAKSVVGIDSSPQYIAEASNSAKNFGTIRFQIGTAFGTGLPSHCSDLVFERALIHHLSKAEQEQNLLEIRRLLRPKSLAVIQDRTIENVQSKDSAHWIRSTLFETYPSLYAFEQNRRPVNADYQKLIEKAGFQNIKTLTYDEIRKTYSNFDQLKKEILSRKGKSILFELTDEELLAYTDRLKAKATKHALVETDTWTVWLGSTP